MEINWLEFKAFIDSRNLSIQYVNYNNNYHLKGLDGFFELECLIPSDRSLSDDTIDFEDNYKANGNKSPTALVTTQFELRNKTLKCVSASEVVSSEDGTVTVLIKVPGTPNPTGDTTLEGRWISSGIAFFDIATPGDKVTSIHFIDHDNILGAGVDFIAGSYVDDEAGDNCGWFIPPTRGQVDAEAIGGYGFAPAGLYIEIKAQKGNGLKTGTFFMNLNWGKVE